MTRLATSKTSEPSRAPVAIDLFCGAGGLTVAVESAGWSTAAAVDHDRTAVATLAATQAARVAVPGQRGRTFLHGTQLISAEIADVRGRDLRTAGVGARWRPDLLAGGPACQPFSSARRQRGLEDPRGPLFVDFVRLADELRPRFVLFENVHSLRTGRTPDGRPGGVLELVQQSFEELGYPCRFPVWNASDYGAAQRRVRRFMLAIRSEALPDSPAPTHARDAQGDLLRGLRPWVKLGEFLANRSHLTLEATYVVRTSATRLADLLALAPGTGLRSRGIVEANRPGGHGGTAKTALLPTRASPLVRSARPRRLTGSSSPASPCAASLGVSARHSKASPTDGRARAA